MSTAEVPDIRQLDTILIDGGKHPHVVSRVTVADDGTVTLRAFPATFPRPGRTKTFTGPAARFRVMHRPGADGFDRWDD